MTKKFLLILGAGVVVMGFLLVRQIKATALITTRAEVEPFVAAMAIDLPISPDEPMLGNPGAPLTLVIFVDFSDAASRRLYQDTTALVRARPDKARLVVKHSPRQSLFTSGSGRTIANAAVCANTQKAFWRFLDAVVSRPRRASDRVVHSWATAAGIANPELSFDACRANENAQAEREKTFATDNSVAGVQEPPALFVNNKRINLQKDTDVASFLATLIQE